MCGVFGFVSKNGQRLSLRRLEKIARVTERRGPHAFGFAWIDSRGRLRMFKQTGRISDSLGVLAMASDARMLVGHCRYATHGDYHNNLNNHPHPCDGGWLIHNGVIHDHEELCKGYLLSPVTHCDSEVLALLIEELDGSLAERCVSAAQIAGPGPLAMLAIWRNPQRLVAVRAGNPLQLGDDERGFYLGSLRPGLPSNAREVEDHSALSFSFRHGQAVVADYHFSEVSCNF